MNTGLGASWLALYNPLLTGMSTNSRPRSSENRSKLKKPGKEILDTLDKLEKEQIERSSQRRRNLPIPNTTPHASGKQKTSLAATSSQQAASMAKTYETKAVILAQQARAYAAVGNDEAASDAQYQSLQAASRANQMHAQEMRLACQENRARQTKLDYEAKDRTEARKAKEAAQEALLAAKQHRTEESRQKESISQTHLESARKARQERQKANIAVQTGNLNEGQFWIHQMQLVKNNSHPDQMLAQARIRTYGEAGMPETLAALDF